MGTLVDLGRDGSESTAMTGIEALRAAGVTVDGPA